MLLTVNRIKSNSEETLSNIELEGLFECFGLEDEHRSIKVSGETRIPQGKYPVRARTIGNFHKRYSDRFPGFHRGMLQIVGVPNFEYVLIHIGNDDEDTAGCLLVGQSYRDFKRITIRSSTLAYKQLYKKVIQAAIDEKLYIEFKDLDL